MDQPREKVPQVPEFPVFQRFWFQRFDWFWFWFWFRSVLVPFSVPVLDIGNSEPEPRGNRWNLLCERLSPERGEENPAELGMPEEREGGLAMPVEIGCLPQQRHEAVNAREFHERIDGAVVEARRERAKG